MRFWFVHSDEISLRAQIVTQVRLGILSGELAPGERLPSIREIARRFHIHPNTVSAAYRQLQQEAWVDFRRGSGVYVRESKGISPLAANGADRGVALDQAIAGMIRTATVMGVPLPELRERFLAALDVRETKELLLIEPDSELREIVRSELGAALNLVIRACGTSDLAEELEGAGAETIALVLPSKAHAVRGALQRGQTLYVLQVSPVSQALTRHLPVSREWLIGVASRWPEFLELARTMLVAAGFAPDAIILRDAGEPGWYVGLDQADAIVCDSVTACHLPSHQRLFAFTLVAENSVAELRDMLAGGR